MTLFIACTALLTSLIALGLVIIALAALSDIEDSLKPVSVCSVCESTPVDPHGSPVCVLCHYKTDTH